MEKDDELKGSGNSYDFGARMLDPRIGRWGSIDPMQKSYPDLSVYHFVRNNPVLRLDPNGQWDITVHAFKDRKKYGYGIAVVTNRFGNEVFRFKVRLEGIGGRDRTKTNSDTPLGVYDIPDSNMWLSGGSRLSYGPNPRLILTPLSGEIKDSGRDLIRVHGGRQEYYNKKEKKWVPVKSPVLKKTKGCLRCSDADIASLKSITDELEENDNNEYGGQLKVVADLCEVGGEYVFFSDPNNSEKEKDLIRIAKHNRLTKEYKKIIDGIKSIENKLNNISKGVETLLNEMKLESSKKDMKKINEELEIFLLENDPDYTG